MSYLLELDQTRVEQQQEIACNLYYDGISDGYSKNPKINLELEYLQGYCEGLLQLCRELELTIKQLEQTAKELVDTEF